MPRNRQVISLQVPQIAEEIVRLLASGGEMIAAAESCTAGLAADLIARVPGASRVFWGSFVTYSPDAKVGMLGVSGELIKKEGAVSRGVALAMAEGALNKSGASWAFSITGLAGPDGNGSEVPVGTVWIGIAEKGGDKGIKSEAKMFRFTGSRNEVREAAAKTALEEVIKKIKGTKTSGN
jgi:nicotinamide-nucleotide amidase